MVRVTLTVLDRMDTYLDYMATVMGTTRSQIINDVLEHVHRNDLESDIWEDYGDNERELKDLIEEEDDSEDEEEEEEEDEGD